MLTAREYRILKYFAKVEKPGRARKVYTKLRLFLRRNYSDKAVAHITAGASMHATDTLIRKEYLKYTPTESLMTPTGRLIVSAPLSRQLRMATEGKLALQDYKDTRRRNRRDIFITLVFGVTFGFVLRILMDQLIIWVAQ